MPLIRKSTPNDSGVQPRPLLAALVGDLESPVDEVRWAAARSAPDVDGTTPALGAALWRETSPRVREAILTALVRIGTPQSVEMVLPLVRSDRAELRTGALDALQSMKSVMWPYIAELLYDQDADVRLLACELTRNLPEEQSTRLLCQLLETEIQANVCASAVEVLAESGQAAALPVLQSCLERFRDAAFLQFSIKLTIDRITANTAPRV